MCLPKDRSGPGSSTELCPESGDVDVADVKLSSCVDETMRMLKKRVMGVEPPTNKDLYALTEWVWPYGDSAGAGVDGFSHSWDTKTFLYNLRCGEICPRVGHNHWTQCWKVVFDMRNCPVVG